jgi:hypothetical protein
MSLLLVCSPSSALGLEKPGNATETLAPEPKKKSDVTASSAVPAIVMLVESSVPEEPPECVVVEARGADLGVQPPMGEMTEAEEKSPKIPTGKLILLPSPI